MNKKLFVIILTISLFIGYTFFYCGILTKENIEIFGIFTAIATSVFSIFLYFDQKRDAQSENYLKETINQFDNVVQLISDNNDRVKWITGSRILASVHLFSDKIEKIIKNEFFLILI